MVFSSEAAFHLCGKVNTYNYHIHVLQNPGVSSRLGMDSLKVNVFCALSEQKVFGPLFLIENTITGVIYLDKLENWLWP